MFSFFTLNVSDVAIATPMVAAMASCMFIWSDPISGKRSGNRLASSWLTEHAPGLWDRSIILYDIAGSLLLLIHITCTVSTWQILAKFQFVVEHQCKEPELNRTTVVIEHKQK